jgi:hypothetical protein
MAYGGAHTWDVNEVFSNADGTVQFVELREANGTPGEVNLAGRPVTSDALGTTFVIPSNVAPPSTNKHLLLATAAFAALPGAPTPDHIIPAGSVPFFSISGDTVRYNPYDAFVFPAVPTDGINSRNRTGTAVRPNSPTNYAGQTGSVDASGPDFGDSDGDGDVDLIDYDVFDDCIEGPDTPAESGCEAFDSDEDTDVDLKDFSEFQVGFTG